MADLNTGSHNLVGESTREQQRNQDAMHAIPGAFPGDSEIPTPSSTINNFPGSSVGAQPQSLAPVENKTAASTKVPITNATTLGHGPSGHPIVSGVDDKELAAGQPLVAGVDDKELAQGSNFTRTPMGLTDRAPLSSDASHPTPPPQSSFGAQPRIPRQADGSVAPGAQGVGEAAVPIERSPVGSTDTVKPGELAQEVAQDASTAAVAGGLAAKDAAVWTKDKAVENYPAARDTVVDNATWAKDRAVENYPAVRDTTVDAATTAGNAAYAGAATAAATIASTAQAAYNATAQALAPETGATSLPPATNVPEPVKDSFARTKESPEAAANASAVGDKRALESELLAIAGSVTPTGDGASVAPNQGADALAAKGPFAAPIPNRTESTDFVKILGTETYNKSHGPNPTGLGAAAQDSSLAHGGGPAAPTAAGAVTGAAAAGAVLGQSGLSREGADSSYTYDKNDLNASRNDTRQASGSLGQSSGVISDQPRSLQADNHIAPPTGTAAQAPGHGPVEGQPPSYSQEPVQTTVGDNAVKEVDYNRLSSGTQSGVASTHYQSQ